MSRLVHLLDDISLGGVTKMIEAMMSAEQLKEHDQDILKVNLARPEVRNLNADTIIVHFSLSWWALPFLYALRKANPTSQLILVEHSYNRDFEKLRVPSIRRFRLMLKLTYRVFDQVVAVSECQANWIRKSNIIDGEKQLVVINPLKDISELHTIPIPLSESKKRVFTVGAYGRFSEEKGFNTLIDAMKLLRNHPIRLRLGGYGPLEKEIEQQISGEENIEFVGKVENLPGFLQSVNAVAIPSHIETFGLVGLEARAAGLPIIASDIDGLREQVRNSGLCVQSGNELELASAINAMSRTDLISLSKQARQSTRGYLETQVQAWCELLNHATSRIA